MSLLIILSSLKKLLKFDTRASDTYVLPNKALGMYYDN